MNACVDNFGKPTYVDHDREPWPVTFLVCLRFVWLPFLLTLLTVTGCTKLAEASRLTSALARGELHRPRACGRRTPAGRDHSVRRQLVRRLWCGAGQELPRPTAAQTRQEGVSLPVIVNMGVSGDTSTGRTWTSRLCDLVEAGDRDSGTWRERWTSRRSGGVNKGKPRAHDHRRFKRPAHRCCSPG